MAVICLVAGCGGVVADARHSALIDTTAAAAQVIAYKAAQADACETCVGEFTRDDVKDLLTKNGEIWLYFQQAKSGQGTFPTTGLGDSL
jgi:hypothetical protein